MLTQATDCRNLWSRFFADNDNLAAKMLGNSQIASSAVGASRQAWRGWDMLVRSAIITASVIASANSKADSDLPLTPEGDPYEVSLSGEIRGSVKYDSECKTTNPDVIDGVFIVAEEVTTIGEPRRMLQSIVDGNFVIDNREPYRDYRVKLMHRRENYLIANIYLHAYNSPPVVQFEFDCKNLKNQIWDMRRARAQERSKNKEKKQQEQQKEQKKQQEAQAK